MHVWSQNVLVTYMIFMDLKFQCMRVNVDVGQLS